MSYAEGTFGGDLIDGVIDRGVVDLSSGEDGLLGSGNVKEDRREVDGHCAQSCLKGSIERTCEIKSTATKIRAAAS